MPSDGIRMGTLQNSSTDQTVTPGATFAFPLTFAQLRLWFLDQLESEQTSYLIPWALRIRGALNAEALASSLNQLVERHEIFRTTFVATDGEPMQLVSPTLHIPMSRVDLSRLDLPAAEQEARRLAHVEAETPIHLHSGPLLRAQLLSLTLEDHVLLLTTHHIIFDGWSRSVLVRELGCFYESALSVQPAQLPDLPIQYADFAVWQREHLSGEHLDRQLSYWKQQLKDLPLSIELPTDRPRPAVQSYNGASFHFTLPLELSEQIKALDQKEGVTRYMTLLAAFQALLARYTGQDDIVVGTPTANRNRSELEGIIGLFANTLVLRTQLGGDPTFRDLLSRVKETALSAFTNEEMPFEQLVQELRPERSLSHSPLFQVLFSLRNTPGSNDFHLADLNLEFFSGSGETSKYDLSLYLNEQSSGIHGKLEYNTDLYDEATIQRILNHYQRLLESAIKEPEKRLSELDMLGAAERAELLVEWNDTAREYQRDRCLHELFEEQAEQHNEAIAVSFGEARITYGELNKRANQLAHHLKKQGIGVGQRVGLFVERSLEMFVGLLGIQKSGAAYVPLDPAYPAERVRATLEAAAITLLVSQQDLLSALPEYHGSVVCLDRDQLLLAQQSAENLRSGVTPDDVVYVIFTSGSTGRPKGVELGHRGVVNLLEWMRGELHFEEGDVFPALASFAFDMSVPELYLALVSGGTVALARRHLAADGEELARFLREHRATLVHATPTTWSLLLDASYTGQGVTRCIGAEPLPTELFGRLMDAAPGTPLYNFYGPTETTVWSTFHRFDSGTERVVIGRPLANTEIYIVDHHGNPVPIGVPGELLIGGDGVAKGYLNQPELTAEKFIPNSFSHAPEALLYRTGDLGRYLPDGRIEFAGRVDHQVKIRGYRVELGEIETVLAQQEQVRECVVLAREDEAGDKRLVAYIVPEIGCIITANQMREWVKQRLPEHMVPSAFVVLDRLPLSPNGKVDRKALPAPEKESASIIGEMGNPVEEMIANIWAEVLKTGEVTQTANFFDLGGHSLIATKVVARIRQMLHVNLPLGAIFDAPTVAGLAARVRALVREDRNPTEAPLVPVASGHALPLSFAQQRLWFLDQLEPNSPFYNVPMAIRLTGVLDSDAMEKALEGVVARHESLRTTFQLQDGQPIQVVSPALSLPLAKVDLSCLPEAECEDELRRLVGEEAQRPFNLSAGPLFRSLLLTLGAEDHVLMVNLHHAISDGWSLGILFNDLTALYEAFRAGAPSPLPPLPLKYGDYAVWQRKYLEGGALEQQLDYWKKHMEGAPLSIELPTDRVRPPAQTFRGAKQVAVFPQELLDGLKALSRAEGATLFITLLSVFNVLLARYSGQKDLVVGTAIAGRQHPETEKLIGFFTNTLVLRTDLSGEPTFLELLRHVRETTLNAYANQDVPFEKLVEELNPVRDMSRSPLFQVMIIQQNAFQRSNTFGSLKTVPYSASGAAAKVDLLLNVSELDGQLRCALDYNTDLFDAQTIERMLGNYLQLLEAAVAHPEDCVSELSLLGEEERDQILVEFNATSVTYAKDLCLHDFIALQAGRTPDAVALVCGEERLSYRTLNARANQLAHYLIQRGAGPDVLIGIHAERTAEMLTGILGILKSGSAYVPLDPNYPKERLGNILQDAQAPVVLTQKLIAHELPDFAGRRIYLDANWVAISQESTDDPATAVTPQHLAYVLFTSGSTGRPKGVAIEHRSAAAFVHWAQEVFTPQELAGVLFSTSMCFDLSVFEMFVPLSVGGKIIVAENALYLPTLPARDEVTLINTVPSAIAELVRMAGVPDSVTTVNLAGEALPEALVEQIYVNTKAERVYNLYGPTEDTTYSTYTLVRRGTPVTVGRAIANSQAYILDAHLNPVPIGVSGELYLAGEGLARGYYGRPDLTAERFVPNPFSAEPCARMYRTGDLTRFLPDGNIEYLGRMDHQVKIRGFRIEMGEIETVLGRHPAVRECVVIAREDQPGNKTLAAYVVPKDIPKRLDIGELRAFIKVYLPDYMVPTGWMELERLPLSANGKVSRKDLPAPDQSAPKEASGREPRTLVEIRLASIWEEVLGVASVRVDDDFFNLGGHSLLAVQMISRAREAFGCDLPLTLLFTAPKLGDLAHIIQEERGKHPFKTIIPIRKTGSKPPLFCISRPNTNALGFIFLTRSLSPDQPVIGLQSQMEKDGSNWVFDQVEYESKAKEYIKAMREVYPNGPYLLTGYCEGAHIAFEMARELESMHLPVAMIAILDAWPIENSVSRTKYVLRGYIRELRKFRRMSTVEKFHFLTRFLFANHKQVSNDATINPTALKEAQQRKLEAEQIEKRYWPGPDFVPTKYSGRLTLFRTRKQMNVRINDYKMGWAARALGGVDVIPVPGTHRHLLREPHVVELAQKMQACIDLALAKEAEVQKQVDVLPNSMNATANAS